MTAKFIYTKRKVINMPENNYPKLHNAAWPGVVGKGSEDGEPFIELDEMIDLTAKADVGGVKFDGFDIFLYAPHFNIDGNDDDIKELAEKASSRSLDIGTVVAPVWGPTEGGPAMGTADERKSFLGQVRKACNVAKKLREIGVRPNGFVRIDSASSVADWTKDPVAGTKQIAETFQQACDIAADYGETLAAEGEICWAGMHSWKDMVELFEMVDRPNLGFQADMAHTLLYTLGYNAPKHRLLPEGFDWNDTEKFHEAYTTMTDALRPWSVDLHIAQNDATVFGSGSHDKTGRHCLADDPNGKLDITREAGYWMRENGEINKKFRSTCWDGCMFPNDVMRDMSTWNNILSAMVDVRKAHGWYEAE
jgi:sugar phosphate isomerase/epimerase